MLWSKVAPPLKSLYKRYWETGTIFTRDTDVEAAKNLNPTFIYSSAGEKFNLHPATFPRGFHLAPAMTPTISGSKKTPPLETEEAIVYAMRRQSESWAESFLAARTADAIKLRANLNSVTGVFGSEWHAGQVTFFDAVPLVYDVIETSSLTVDLDILNLLIATRPLLKDDPASQSVLFTEERMSVAEFDEHLPTLNRLGATIPTISSLFGLAPRVYLSDSWTYSDLHETLSREHVGRSRERIAWVNPAGGDHDARKQKSAMSFDVDDLVQVVYGIYSNMFSREVTRIAVVVGRKLPYEAPFHYTRETIVMLIKYLRRTVHLKNGTWDKFGKKFAEVVKNDWCSVAGKTYWVDLCVQLHLAGIHSVDSLRDLPGELPPIVCVALTAPRRKLQILFDHKEKNCTPVLEAHLRCTSAALRHIPCQMTKSPHMWKHIISMSLRMMLAIKPVFKYLQTLASDRLRCCVLL
ncbi:MYND Zn-finger protein [Ceratobasidium sp. AG-Ba]|nr:MYND Zn-finger protein [Ceratobasidium sp. AG-Ba]